MFKSTKEIAQQFGVSVSYIRKLISQKKLKAIKIGSYYAIDSSKMKGFKRVRKVNKDKDATHESNQ